MDLSDSPAEATFRAEVRAFLDENADKYPNRGRGWEEGDFPGSEAMKPWRDALVDKGWIAPHWPKEYGGAGLSAQEQFVLNEEFAEAGVNNVGGFGVMMIGPTLMVHGTDEQKQEHLRTVLLDTRNRVLSVPTIYVGSLNSAQVRVGEVFRHAIRANCASMIVVHNHPSGDPSPSPEDVQVTRLLVEAGSLLNIDVLDHLIIGRQRFVSLKERGLGFK